LKSTAGDHFVALDHVRGIAALLVFCWHFLHGRDGTPVPFEGAPIWGPLVLFDEGHVGVALFMTLSGYLFAKLLDGKRVDYPLFLLNRALRLMPLLLLVYVINALLEAQRGGDARIAYWFLRKFPEGFVFPSWPNGGWSIAVELHFYLLLPILLTLARRTTWGLWAVVAVAIAFRGIWLLHHGEVQTLAYHTILGRVDQFILGIAGFIHRRSLTRRHLTVAALAVAFLTFYGWFDASGGLNQRPVYPSPSALWVVMPTIEGLACSALIAWYDTSFRHGSGPVSKFFSMVGEYSYSIYLLHFFFVVAVAQWMHKNLLDLSNFYIALPVALICFTATIPLGYLSMRFIERPFLRFRRSYLRPSGGTDRSAPVPLK
jgi:peptidoglycan/LPS O-acetylase OafA/YrhL